MGNLYLCGCISENVRYNVIAVETNTVVRE